MFVRWSEEEIGKSCMSPDNMTTSVQIFGSHMKNQISNYAQSTLAITIEN